MNRLLPWTIFAALMLAGGGIVRAQAEAQIPSALRDFTTKQGRTLTARIVALSPENQQLTLRSADLRQYSLTTVELCLEDQLFVRDWIEAQQAPVATAEESVELLVEELVQSFERRHFDHGNRTFTHEEMREGFHFKVRHRDPKFAAALRAEYFILYWDKIFVYPVDGGKRTDWSSYSGKGRIHYRYDEIRFPAGQDNGEQEKTTATATIDRLEGETEAERIGHDRMIGIRVRLVDPLGNIAAEFCDFPAAFSELDWAALHAARQADDTQYEKSGAVSRAARGVLQVRHAEYEKEG